ncbi:MAG: DUF1232 domain-containing protein [Sphingomonas sp.]|nr:DUF1232 domain-containing protein [Sphingomonas sp.]
MQGQAPVAPAAQASVGREVTRRPSLQRLKNWAARLKRDVIALWFAARDPRVPWYAKAVAAAVAAYALSPIDLIPDFIPVLGYLDDLLIVPLGIWAAIRLVPEAVMIDLRAKALERSRPTSTAGLVGILLIWISAASLTLWLLWPC